MILFLFLAVFAVNFAAGSTDDTENADGGITPKSKNIPIEDFIHGEMVRELTDAELSKIVAEQPFDDPLNAFFDPFEPYRLSTFAYWHPITYPKEHVNPPLPAGFLPLNAPPKNFPTDFFFKDGEAVQTDESRRIVLGEHAASFCPYLRRWREKHPLKPYPVESDFLQSHPPIKFVPGKGYEIDTELARLNALTRQAQEQILREAAPVNPVDEAVISSDSDAEDTSATEAKSAQRRKQKEHRKKRKKSIWQLSVLLDVIEKVKKARPDCKKNSKFLDAQSETDYHFSSRPSCLEEVIFYMDELEDIHDPVDLDDGVPEIVNKIDYYRQILIDLDALNTNKREPRKCPFGFKKKPDDVKACKIYQGTVPKWAELQAGETVYSSDDEAKMIVSSYRFQYKQVPFPSIQDTLKKYVSI